MYMHRVDFMGPRKKHNLKELNTEISGAMHSKGEKFRVLFSSAKLIVHL